MEKIELKNITKSYGDLTIYKDFNLNIEKNKITTILGESGSGKTTLLNILAGLTDFSGEIIDKGKVSFIFQQDRLVPNLTVMQNLELVLGDFDIEIDKELEKVGLLSFKNYYPKQLSGGMARKVAFLRGFLYPSDTLLMDEPFINLDLKLKSQIIQDIKKSKQKTPKTIVFVTHDIFEAINLSDRIIVIKQGKIIEDINDLTKNQDLYQKLFYIMTN